MAVTKPQLSLLERATLILAILRARSLFPKTSMVNVQTDQAQWALASLPSSQRRLGESLDP